MFVKENKKKKLVKKNDIRLVAVDKDIEIPVIPGAMMKIFQIVGSMQDGTKTARFSSS